MHVLIIFLIFRINSTSSEISKINQNYAKYKAEASSMLGGSSTLSEAVASLLMSHTLVTNEINTVPLTIFADEVADKTRRGSTISEHFSTYSLSEDITTSIQAAAEASDRLLEADLHALALFFAAYGKPNIPQIASLEVPALTETTPAIIDTATTVLKIASFFLFFFILFNRSVLFNRFIFPSRRSQMEGRRFR